MDLAKAVIEFIREGLWLYIAWTCFVLTVFLMPESFKNTIGINVILNGPYGPWIAMSGILTSFLSFGAIGRRLWYKVPEFCNKIVEARAAKRHLKKFRRLPIETQMIIGVNVIADRSKFPCSLEHSGIQHLVDQNWGFISNGGYHFYPSVWDSFRLCRKQIREDFQELQQTNSRELSGVISYLKKQEWHSFY